MLLDTNKWFNFHHAQRFLKKNTSISNFATDYQLQLCAPLGGLNILVRFNFRSLLNKISHPYMAKACKSYGGYKLFITLDQKTQVVPIGSMSKGELVHKIGHPTLGIPVIKLSFARALWNLMDGYSLGPLKIYVIFHIRARRAGAKNLQCMKTKDEAEK